MTKTNHFYTHLASIEQLAVALSELDLSENERVELIMIVESSLHFTVIDLVLTHLQTEDKKTFLEHASKTDHNKTWKFLNTKIQDLEKKIIKAAKELHEELLKDIKETKQKNRAIVK